MGILKTKTNKTKLTDTENRLVGWREDERGQEVQTSSYEINKS